MLSAGRQSQVAGGLRRAVRQGSRAGSEGEKINLVIAVARATRIVRGLEGKKINLVIAFAVG